MVCSNFVRERCLRLQRSSPSIIGINLQSDFDKTCFVTTYDIHTHTYHLILRLTNGTQNLAQDKVFFTTTTYNIDGCTRIYYIYVYVEVIHNDVIIVKGCRFHLETSYTFQSVILLSIYVEFLLLRLSLDGCYRDLQLSGTLTGGGIS